MNDNGEIKKTSSFAWPPGSYVPMEPSQHTLMEQNHGEWLGEFAKQMSRDLTAMGGAPMTPFRQGAVTRLFWAMRYIEFCDKQRGRLEARIVAAEKTAAEVTASLATTQASLLALEAMVEEYRARLDPQPKG